ncbi:MAG: ribosomal 5S rRNA E-loop-binding protein Ctc/L25/TL5 [Planctomycetes bacterium SCN 63-9]|nr:MAG: ribosomal 5S rRNA E-loop-binding protein Ctc/L25/TL5 [Planctomycetes bacterium SCN 63-9]
MSETLKIRVEPRDAEKNKGTGTRVARRLRTNGRIPAVIYGHKQAVLPISLAREDVWGMIKSAAHLAELDLGGSTETVLIRDVQWDHLGKEILHLDFARVSAEESIQTEVRIELKGQAPGLAGGGVLEQLLHELEVTCPAGAIPDVIKVDVSNLQLNQGIHVRELTLPQGVVATADPEQLVVHVVEKGTQAEPVAGGEAASQPEVIKPERKEKEKDA